MGGKNSKQTKTVVCTNPRVDEVCSLERVKFTLPRDKKRNQVLLKDLEFKMHLPPGRFSYDLVCATSNDFYLISDSTKTSVIKLHLSSGKCWELNLHACIENLFFLEQNRAAAAIRFMGSSYIYLIETDVLRVVRVIPIFDEVCKGVVQIEEMLYIGFGFGIAVCNSDGQRKGFLNELSFGDMIIHVAKGPQNTLFSLEGNPFDFALKVVDTSGRLLRSFYRSKSTLLSSPPFPSQMTIDLEGNVYVLDHKTSSCLKITPEGNLETFQYPESRITNICYDANNDMLVFLCMNCIALKSSKS